MRSGSLFLLLDRVSFLFFVSSYKYVFYIGILRTRLYTSLTGDQFRYFLFYMSVKRSVLYLSLFVKIVNDVYPEKVTKSHPKG